MPDPKTPADNAAADALLPSEPPRETDDNSIFDEALTAGGDAPAGQPGEPAPAEPAPPRRTVPGRDEADPAHVFDDAGRDEPRPSPMRDWLRSHNFEIDEDATDEDIEQVLGGTVEELERAQTRNRQLETLLAQRQQQPAEPATPAEPAPAAPAAEEPAYNPPKVTPAALRMVEVGIITRDQRGLYQSEDPRFSNEVSELNSRQAYEEHFFRGLREDPMQFVATLAKPAIDDALKPLREENEKLRQQLTQQQEVTSKQTIGEYFDRNAAMYYVFDDKGEPVMDGERMKLTARGRVYAAANEALKELIPDANARHEHIIEKHIKPLGDDVETPTAAGNPKPASRQERNTSFLRRVAQTNGRTTTSPTVPRPARRAPTDESKMTDREILENEWDTLIEEGLANIT